MEYSECMVEVEGKWWVEIECFRWWVVGGRGGRMVKVEGGWWRRTVGE